MSVNAMASYVAKAPRNSVAARTPNRNAAKFAAPRLKSRLVMPCSRIVASSMNDSERRRAPASPPKWFASAPSGGYKTGAPEK